MGNCLKTQLKENVNNEKLFTLTDFVVKLPTEIGDKNFRIRYATKSNQILRIAGEGHFIVGGENVGKTVETGNANVDFVVSFVSTEGDLLILPERADIKKISNGYIQYLPVSIPFLEFESLNSVTYNGNDNTKNFVNFKNLSNLINLVEVELAGNSGYGSIFDVVNVPSLKYFETKNKDIVADLAIIPINLWKYAGHKDNAHYSWSLRDISKDILCLIDISLGNSVDAYLNNVSQCHYDSNTLVKIIRIYGNRTSASDAAVSTLKGLGYTITVNGETL